MRNITIIGSGSFGCALAHVFGVNNRVKMWSYTKEEAESINNNHECMILPSIKLDKNIKCYQDYKEAIDKSDLIVLVTPSDTIRNTCKSIKEYISNQEILLASKGMENDILLTDVIKEELEIEASVIMGPSFAEEIGDDLPTYVELSGNKELIKDLETRYFKINYINDSVGLQVGGALKNVITIACGLVEGLGYKVNTSSYIITEGLKELKNIGISLGAQESTFYGLSGIGDLYGTSLSNKSRNKRAGILLGQGKSIEEIHKEIGTTIEGLDTLKDVKYIINSKKIECPLLNDLYDIVYKNIDKRSIL